MLDSLPDFSVTPISPTTSRNISISFQSLLALNIKFYLLFLRPKWEWHLNISVTSSDFRPLPHPFVLYAPWTGGSFLSLGLGQPWPCLDLLPLLPLLFGITFHLQLVLLSSVCLWLLRGAIQILEYNTVQYLGEIHY